MRKSVKKRLSMLIDEKNIKFDKSLDSLLILETPFMKECKKWIEHEIKHSNLLEIIGKK
jgi:hypothetical protein